jgi:hypothetical protein
MSACAGFGVAQNATGSIHGSVWDEQQSVIPGAAVAITNKATGNARNLTTGPEGAYAAESLLPGEYEIRVVAPGFTPKVEVVQVQVGATATADFTLPVGSTSESVVITSEAPIVNTTDSQIGGVVDRRRVEDLPTNGRSFLSMAGLQPGVIVGYNSSVAAGNPNNFFTVSIDGAASSQTVISVDGARVNDRITGGTSQNFSAETVQEFQISTVGFDLSAGTVSAGAVNIVSRTGSNDLHGSSFFFFRDHNIAAFTGLQRPSDPTAFSPLCADPASATCARLRDPFFVRRQYGSTIGGPIKKNKLFFFANYERNDQVGARQVTFTDPLLFGYNHIGQQPARGHLAGLRLDYTISPNETVFFRSNVDSNAGISGPVIARLESTWTASSNFAYQEQMGLTSVFKPTLVNDFRFSYSYFRNRLAPPTQSECEQIAGDPSFCSDLNGPLIAFFGGLQAGTNNAVPQDRHPRTFQWNDNMNWIRGTHRVRFGGNWEHSYNHGTWYRQYAGTFSAFSPAQLQASSSSIYNALPFSLKTGYTGPRPTFQELLQLPMTGTLTIGIGDPTYPAPFRFKDVLSNDHIRFYIQDAWQVRPRLTLNYGLGWAFENRVFYHDLDLPDYLRPLLGNDLGAPRQNYRNFDPALGFAWAPGQDRKTALRSSISLHHISPNSEAYNFNQRILFGPAGNGLQAASGASLTSPQGVLLNFGAPTSFTLADMMAFLPVAKAQLTADILSKYNGRDLSIRGVELTKTVQGSGNNDAIYNNNSGPTPYTIQVDAGMQREIVRNLSVSADYVMRRGVHFGAFDHFFPDLNLWYRFSDYSLSATGGIASQVRNPVIPACTAANRNDPKAECSLGPIQYGLPGILSRYSALQVKVDRRFSESFQFGGAYALSRYTLFSGITSNTNYADGDGVSTVNPKHIFTFNGLWDLPKYGGPQRFFRGALNGWQLSTIMQMQTGPPMTVSIGTNDLGPASGFDIHGDGNYTFRLPGAGVGSFGSSLGVDDIRKLVARYNATFPAPKDTPLSAIPKGPQRDTAGTAYPYIVLPDKFASGDSLLTHDLRVSRAITVAENVKLQLIGEGFNIFNIANLNFPASAGTLDAYIRPTATTPGRNPNFAFGQPTSRVDAVFGSGGPRAFQFAARLSF